MKKNYKVKTLFLSLLLISATSAFAQHDTIANGGFEAWTSSSGYSNPNGWNTDNSLTYAGGLGSAVVFKETAAAHVHSGVASAELKTASIFGNIGPGLITNGVVNSSGVFDGGAINYRPYKIRGWFQFAPHSATDTFTVSLSLYTGNTFATPIGTANFLTTSTVTAWTKWDVLIAYTGPGTPDSMQIIIASGTGNNSTAGTIAYVDDVSLVDCSLLSVSATPTAASCTQSNGSVVAAGTGGTGPYTYVWSNTSTTATISSLAPATYSVVATDAEGCSASSSAAVTTSNVPFTVNLTPVAASCTSATGSVTAAASTGTSPYTYLWSNTATTTAINNVIGGNYSVTVTDANGCTTTASSSVSSPNVPFTVTPTGGTTSCISNTGTVSVVASAGNSPYTYLWSNTATTAQINSLGAGNYAVTVTDADGCTSTATAAVTTPSGPSATDAVTNALCHSGNTGAVDVTVSGGTAPLHYLWSNGATVVSIAGVTAGTYTLTITDNNNCTFQVSANVSQPTAISASGTVTNVSCFGGSNGAISVSGATGGTLPYTYSWNSNPNTNLTAGSYQLTITDANACADTLNFTVSQPSILLLQATQSNVLCNGNSNGAADVTPSGGTYPYNYLWSNGAADSSITGLSAAAYYVIVTDANQCRDSLNLTITQPQILAVSISPTPATSATAADGSAIALGSGGSTPLNYAWSNHASGGNITGLIPATYCVTVTDVNSCTASACDSVSYTTGIKTISSVLVKIYPNPASSLLTIETNAADGKFLFSIFSLDGKLVDEKTIAGMNITISLNQLADGFYTYQLKDTMSGNVNYGKLEIQH